MYSGLNIILSLFNVVLIILLFLYWNILYNKEKKLKEKEEKALNESKEILQDAQHKANNIISEAGLVNKGLHDEAEENFEQTVINIEKENKKFYQQVTKDFEKQLNEFNQLVSELSKKEFNKYEEEIKNNVVELKSSLEKIGIEINNEVKQATSEIDKNITTQLKQTQNNLMDFKAKEKELFREHIDKKINEIVEELLPQYISLEDHEKLIEKSIEKAEKEGLFS